MLFLNAVLNVNYKKEIGIWKILHFYFLASYCKDTFLILSFFLLYLPIMLHFYRVKKKKLQQSNKSIVYG